MKHIHTIFINAITLFCFCLSSCNPHNSQLKELDAELEKRLQYHDLKKDQINTLKDAIAHTEDLEPREIYEIYNKLYSEYISFRFDSAYKYTNLLCNTAKNIDMAHIVESKTKLGSVLSNGGFFKEAIDSLSAIEITRHELPDNIAANYYITLGRTYHNLADYTSDNIFTPVYNSLGNEALQKSIDLVNDSVTIYWLKGKIELKNNNIHAAKEYFEHANQIAPADHMRKGVIRSTLAHIYYRLGDYDKSMNYYVLCSIDNVQKARTENVALRGLATLLFYQKNDINKAAQYINIALDDATLYSARHRKIAIGNLHPIIVGEKLELVESRHQSLFAYFTLIIILTIGLSVLSIITIRQMKKLRRQKKLLVETNHDLSEANLIKEEYIGHYFHINSTIVNQVEKFTQIAINKLKLKQYDELKRLIDNLGRAHNKKAFYKEFDRSFLKIFPSFVDDYNKLMPETEKISVPEYELNTTLRIFALIRLGITDTDEISRIIDYASNTVYNYRIRARKKSLVDVESFEKLIRSTGI